MNEIMKLTFDGKQCRTVEIGGHPFWVGKDVCDILGYKNHRDALKNHVKGVEKIYPLVTAGGMQKLRVINEPDLYRLIGGSKLPEAQRFEAWIFEEIIPSIHKTGMYIPASSGYQDKAAETIQNLTAQVEYLQETVFLYEEKDRLHKIIYNTGRPLSKTEQQQVLDLHHQGLSSPEIAEKLYRRSDSAIRSFLRKVEQEKGINE